MKALILGCYKFIVQNLYVELQNKGYNNINIFSAGMDMQLSHKCIENCDFIFYIGSSVDNRSSGHDYLKNLLDMLKDKAVDIPILAAFSYDEDEMLLYKHMEIGTKTYIYRLPGVFGKWSNPDTDGIVAKYCYAVANGIEIEVDEPFKEIELCYIDDVVAEFIKVIEGEISESECILTIPVTYRISQGGLLTLIQSLRNSREDLCIPDMGDELTKKLYSTYLSFLPKDSFAYDLNMHSDDRGCFTEFLKSSDRGQVSVNLIKPGVVKGNHWHQSKCKKYLVVKGKGLIRFRRVDSDKITEYYVSGDKLQVVDIPPGYVHTIGNVGDEDMIVVMWVNEVFNPDRLDTYPEEV